MINVLTLAHLIYNFTVQCCFEGIFTHHFVKFTAISLDDGYPDLGCIILWWSKLSTGGIHLGTQRNHKPLSKLQKITYFWCSTITPHVSPWSTYRAAGQRTNKADYTQPSDDEYIDKVL